MHRRHLLGATAAGLLGALALPKFVRAADDYRALVVLYLYGGSDGNNVIVPTDAAYNDYQTARANLALPKASLVGLSGSSAGHTFGLHPALAPLAPLYDQGRLGFVANVGPLIQPTTVTQALTNSVKLPPFLFSHSDQQAIVQGWTVGDDTSGWAGRSIEQFPAALRHGQQAVTVDGNRTLVQGQRSAVSFMPPGGARWWGAADLAQPETTAAQSINRMARWQFANEYEAEYARTMAVGIADSTLFTRAFMAAAAPAADFGASDGFGGLAERLRSLASVLPIFRAMGLKRQVFVVSWGSFDTHANQRGSDAGTQDAQLAVLAKALSAFDATNRANGLDRNIVTLGMSEFGRTVRPGSGGGSEHAWGNHWFTLGGAVAGGAVHGAFPSPVLGGPDDGDPGKNGRHVPTTSSDQVGATLMQWLGLPPERTVEAFPNLVNFPNKTLALLRA